MDIFRRNQHRGLTSASLRLWGMLFVAAGAISQGVLQNRLLGLGGASAEEVLTLMQTRPGYMTIASVALILQAAESCAVPIFALLLVEGFLHTKDWKKFLLRVAIAAVAGEFAFDLLYSNKLMDLGSQNPGFALVLGLIMLKLYSLFAEKTWSHRFIRLFVAVAAIMWAEMFSIYHGTPLVVLAAVFWLMRKKHPFRGLTGAGVSLCFTVISPFYLACPLGAMAVHGYNGKPGPENRLINYALYPALLLILWAAATLMF